MVAARTIVGIDPASGNKGSYIFSPDDDIDTHVSVAELNRQIQKWKQQTCLICWDAPLTGPPEPDSSVTDQSFTQRPIESAYRKHCAEVPGVSVLGFSQLSHWTVSRHALGLPRVGQYDLDYNKLPLGVVFSKEDLDRVEAAVTEVHPTLAAWRFLRNRSWVPYKGETGRTTTRYQLAQMWQSLLMQTNVREPMKKPKELTGDAFDARVSWLLGYLWVSDTGVSIVGNRRTGTFLMPQPVDESIVRFLGNHKV